ncbi:hypothetical protein CTA1_8025 [Colletotrichum tanaceti]|uniref:Uncharacterized protein n=1 Tax=Colletotrichum tanaceti TaxID=1306861 RepID=A0A4U6XMK6_9PEZI|nr:hypothetical protein CTA1_8025 [Colletotrichum tanaceti]
MSQERKSHRGGGVLLYQLTIFVATGGLDRRDRLQEAGHRCRQHRGTAPRVEVDAGDHHERDDVLERNLPRLRVDRERGDLLVVLDVLVDELAERLELARDFLVRDRVEEEPAQLNIVFAVVSRPPAEKEEGNESANGEPCDKTTVGAEGPRHLAQVDLTEAEAAAVATLKTSAVDFRVGSLFLTVDAGGGTTDLAVMQITSTDSKHPQMSQISEVKGVGIGASLIDVAFINLVNSRLAAYPEAHRLLPHNLAFRMSRSHHFKTVKHKFGERAYMQPVFKIQLEGVSHDFSHAGLRIVDGRMMFTMQEIQVLFDVNIEGILRCIREQLDRLVKKQQPQEIQKMETGRISVLATRIARASYGVLIKEVYSPQQHFDEEIQNDRFDPKKRWAMNQIRWLIRKGDSVNPNSPLVHSLAVSLAPGDTKRSRDAHIVVSHNETSFLPKSMKQEQLVLKNKRGTCFSKGYTFYLLNFDIRVIIAPADLRFELWFGGQKFSGNHEPIAVSWDQEGVKAGEMNEQERNTVFGMSPAG